MALRLTSLTIGAFIVAATFALAAPSVEAAKRVPHAKFKAGITYIPTRNLENGGDRWIGPFGRTPALACLVGGRSYYFKSEVIGPTAAGTCPGSGIPLSQFTIK